MTKSERLVLIIGLVLSLFVTSFSFFFPKKVIVEEAIVYKDSLRVLLDIHRSHRDSLVAGYNYHLLENFSAENEVSIDIKLGHRRHFSLVDSLWAGGYDIVVTRTKPERDSILSIRIDSLCYYCSKIEDSNELERLNTWFSEYYKSEDYEPTRKLFFRVLNPHRSKVRENLSPYDALIKQYADSLGWDWRRFAALVYHESQFHIEAHSRRGARGLMQLMPRTANHYGAKDVLNPEENIAAACRLLKDLDSKYYRYTNTQTERFKFVLAAYNAGVGRMKDIISLASSRGVDTSCWDSLKTVIPIMNDSTLIDTNIVKLGVFKGTETISYVDTIEDIYSEFQKIVE